MTTSREEALAISRIRTAGARLGFTFLQLQRLLVFDPRTPTAAWHYDATTGHESIHVGPEIASLEIDSIEMVLRHEFLHRSTYREFSRRFKDPQLVNVVEDICINRLLFEAYPDQMRRMSAAVYTDESKTTVIALCDCTADPERLDPDLKDLWKSIWEREGRGYPEINPASLYYRLYRLQPEIPQEFFHWERAVGNGPVMTGTLRDAVFRAAESTAVQLGSASDLGRTMSEYLNVPVRMGSDRLKGFLEQIEADRIISDVSNPIKETFTYTRSQPWPGIPDRRGLTFLITGLSDLIRMYHNRVTEVRDVHLSLAFYIDISGSMEAYFSAVHAMIRAVVAVPLGLRTFADQVSKITVDDFLTGRFTVGGGTDFDPVIEDFLADDQAGSALVVTDGDARLSRTLSDRMEQSGKPLYVVYFGDGDLTGPLARVATRWQRAG